MNMKHPLLHTAMASNESFWLVHGNHLKRTRERNTDRYSRKQKHFLRRSTYNLCRLLGPSRTMLNWHGVESEEYAICHHCIYCCLPQSSVKKRASVFSSLFAVYFLSYHHRRSSLNVVNVRGHMYLTIAHITHDRWLGKRHLSHKHGSIRDFCLKLNLYVIDVSF